MRFIRGDTFEFTGPVTVKVNGVETTDLTGWSATSQARTEKGVLLDDLVVTFVSFSPAVLNVAASLPTQDWIVGPAKMDIQFLTPTGKIVSTQTFSFTVLQDVTREG